MAAELSEPTIRRLESLFVSSERAHAGSILIEECGKLQLANGFVAGAGVDHLQAPSSRREIVEGVVCQARLIQEAGGMVTILPLLSKREMSTFPAFSIL